MALRHRVEGRDRKGRSLHSGQGKQLVSKQSNTELGRIFLPAVRRYTPAIFDTAHKVPHGGSKIVGDKLPTVVDRGEPLCSTPATEALPSSRRSSFLMRRQVAKTS